ncbi:concanavalin A-like lectin/glucanase domain-containing protein [Fusarium tricinctum]|uniref:Concanavalin A-like lectin/glucanase domain-containing protein n=2 Tax=Fusarium tricinctum species complex TaxID=679429 RepID=A0A8K0W6M8_9HYPO|nr:concanavalin A-like lectin/glucanase domain-containing protein [Fusarium tricinctum]
MNNPYRKSSYGGNEGAGSTDIPRRSMDSNGNPIDAASTGYRHSIDPGRGSGSGGHGGMFSIPEYSSPPSEYNSSAGSGTHVNGQNRYFHSRRVKIGEVEKPWLEKTNPKEKWVSILPILAILFGLVGSGFLVWDGIRSVVKNKYCPVLDEDFSQGLNPNIWTREVEVGGYGNGQFEQTTGGDDNVYIENGNLVIKATMQDPKLMQKNNVINLLKDGTCTSKTWSNCVAATNVTAGNNTVVPPARSGRINTKKGANIKYGRIEVTAKLPEGDWLWPAIWMLPRQSVYGTWPRSGEIDIAESRGNNWTYKQGGNDIVSSALHWGPNSANDGWWKTNNKRKALHTTYSAGFNMFGLEWSEKYLFTYVNTRLLQVTYTNFKKPMYKRGGFPDVDQNGTRLTDPWLNAKDVNAPFDQEFYLILNVAVGGTNGWFEDGKSGKPWYDASPTAKKDFWDAREQWYPTWKQPQLEVSRVVMMQQCNGNEDL